MRPHTRPSANDETLARSFEALANAVRLALLRDLRVPKPLGEIRIAPAPEAESDAALARQSVRRHLDLLLERRLVVAHGNEYGLNHQGLFALAEEVLALSHMRPEVEPDIETAAGHTRVADLESGPCLVLVHGATIGQVYPLANAQTWRLGRHRDVEIPLDFDPYVSGEHARIVALGQGHELVDLEASRNGTTLNLRAIPRGGRQRLRHGDIIGLGRSLLLYRS